ncbi:MAG: energy transducer TonB, partial [Calditrichaeota bacterium]
KAGVEGRVILRVLVDERGNVEATEIAKSSGSKVGLEEAAIKAVRSVKWRPAMQRDLPVKVWIHVPIRFDLKDA